MIGRFFGFLWGLARLFPAAGLEGIRYGSTASVFFSFLVFLFFTIGLVLVLLGFDLDEVDLWLDRNAGTFDLIGTIIWKIMLAGILAICVLVVVAPFLGGGSEEDGRRTLSAAQRREGEQPKESMLRMGCTTLFALAIGYFCYVGIFLL